jgi:hypothetical protein
VAVASTSPTAISAQLKTEDSFGGLCSLKKSVLHGWL